MSTLQKQITEKFLAKLAESKDLHSETVDQLRTLMAAGKKPKADEIVKASSTRAAVILSD
jgi:ribosomal protein S7